MIRKKKVTASGVRELEVARMKLLGMLRAKTVPISCGFMTNVRLIRDYLVGHRMGFVEEAGSGPDEMRLKGVVYSDGPIDTYPWRATVDEDGVETVFRYPIRVRPFAYTPMAEFAMRVTHDLKYGKMTIDLDDDGEVCFRVNIPASFVAADRSLATELLFEMPEYILDDYAPGFLDVLAGVSPQHAFERCNREYEEDEETINNNAAEATDEDEEDEDEDNEQASGLVDNSREMAVKYPPNQEVVASKLPPLAADYSLDGLNLKGPVSLGQLVSAVRLFRGTGDQGVDVPRMNILLNGPSGTGKTEFVKYLAREVKAEVVVVRVSDVIRPQVGMTEMMLAALFRKAARSHAILFLDEVDSLLAARSRAEHSWEVTQVNELLQQMEQFGGVLVAATNSVESLDSAVQRRFTFKLVFDYLSEKGRETFFQRCFKTKLTAKERARLRSLTRLTPGDFRTVRQNQFYLIANPTATQRLDGLEAEMAARSINTRPQVGF